MEEDGKLIGSHENDDVSEGFHDALDDFPFYDSEETVSDSIEVHEDVSGMKDKAVLSSGLRRRRSFSQHKSSIEYSSELSTIGSEVNSELSPPSPRERKLLNFSKSEAYEKKLDDRIANLGFVGVKRSLESGKADAHVGNSPNNEEISILAAADANSSDSDKNDESSSSILTDANNGDLYLMENDGAHSSVLLMLASVIVKAMVFQISLLCKILTFPVWSAYKFYTFVYDPFGFSKRVRGYLLKKIKRICGFAVKNVFPFVYNWLKEQNSWWSLCSKCVWGFLWLCYVCAVFTGLFVSAFLIGGLMIRVVVEEPVRINSNLNFDYKEKNPVAVVSITTPQEPTHNVYIGDKPGFDEGFPSRVIPSRHKLQVTVTLTLPESDYNQNLGIFQVRVDLLTANGKTNASSRRPCMLRYKSQLIRLLQAFLKAAPILTGYVSETQNLKIHFQGFNEGEIPTSFLRVVIEQRAEFLSGAGVPEIYTASATLESELPLLKRLIWSWKKILLIWISMTVFMAEIGFVLICCRSLIIPKLRIQGAVVHRVGALNDRPHQN